MAELPTHIGRYEIVSRLGQGGMGSLYLAKDPKIGRLIAIKLVRREFDSPEARQRFAREAQSAGTLRHPNIVTIFDVDEHAGLPFIALEYVEGETLSEIVRRRASTPLATRLRWIEELCAGLAYAHRQGVVHRDIKPSNLMVDKEGSLKILDFGLARREASKFTQSQAIIGTPNYMSPEQIRAADVGPRSDQFAVGAVLYELLTYSEAFPGTVHQAMHRILYDAPRPLRELLPGVDPALETILARALDKDPSRRYDDLSVMRAELAAVRQRYERLDAEGTETLAFPTPRGGGRPPSGPAHSPGSGAGATPRSGSPVSRRDSAHRLTLQRRRASLIESHLVEARRSAEHDDFESARKALDEALVLDPDHPASLQLLDEIAAAEERQQIARAVAAARGALREGRLEAAEQIVAQAMELAPHAPEIAQLRDLIETARREIERARQVQDILRRARARFSEGSFEGAIRAVGELLAIDPQNAAARELQARAQEAIEARDSHADRAVGARAAVAHARELFERGDHAGAIALLEAFRPPHELVTGFLASLRGETERAAATPAAPAPSGPPPRRRARLAIVAAAAVVVALAGVAALVQLLGRRSPPPPETTTATPSHAPAAPAAAVTPPAAATEPPRTENDRDAMEAYRLLASGQPGEAAAIVERIGRRDPKNEHVADLRAQIRKAADAERQRAAAATVSRDTSAAPVAAQPAPAVAPRLPDPQPAAPVQAPLPSAPAPIPRSPSAADLERPAIEAAIAEYARALSRRDLPAVARVRRYTAAEARNWENVFKQFSEYRLIVKIAGPPSIEGDRARVPVEEQFAQTAKKGGIQVFSQPRKTEYVLERIGGNWMILPPG